MTRCTCITSLVVLCAQFCTVVFLVYHFPSKRLSIAEKQKLYSIGTQKKKKKKIVLINLIIKVLWTLLCQFQYVSIKRPIIYPPNASNDFLNREKYVIASTSKPQNLVECVTTNYMFTYTTYAYYSIVSLSFRNANKEKL